MYPHCVQLQQAEIQGRKWKLYNTKSILKCTINKAKPNTAYLWSVFTWGPRLVGVSWSSICLDPFGHHRNSTQFTQQRLESPRSLTSSTSGHLHANHAGRYFPFPFSLLLFLFIFSVCGLHFQAGCLHEEAKMITKQLRLMQFSGLVTLGVGESVSRALGCWGLLPESPPKFLSWTKNWSCKKQWGFRFIKDGEENMTCRVRAGHSKSLTPTLPGTGARLWKPFYTCIWISVIDRSRPFAQPLCYILISCLKGTLAA